MAFVEGGELKLFSRNGRNITSQFPELADVPTLVKSESAVLDGEKVCFDDADKTKHVLYVTKTRIRTNQIFVDVTASLMIG